MRDGYVGENFRIREGRWKKVLKGGREGKGDNKGWREGKRTGRQEEGREGGEGDRIRER